MTRAARNARRPTPPFEVRRSPIHGRGAFATRRIRPGRRIIEYTGERISSAEADRRYSDDGLVHHHTFLFEVDRDTVVDAGRGGSAARFINHSCDPNCATFIEGGRIYIEAIRNIQPGVELAYDYRYTRGGRRPPNWRELYACRCGAERCRGTMLTPPPRRRRRRRT